MESFEYKRSNDEGFNAIVDSVIIAARDKRKGIVVPDYADKMREINEAVVKFSVADTRYESMFETQGAALFKNPMVVRSQAVRENFNAVIAQIINAVAPEVTSARYAEFLAEVVQVGWGDTARFIVKSNELFKVNEVAEGINRGVLQPIYDDEYTVNCGTIEIATSVDWYPVAAGVFDWGDFALRAGRSFEGYIFLKIIAAMTSAVSEVGAGYSASGLSNANWTALRERVRAANGGAAVYAIGTLGALGNVYPTVQGLQYGLGSEIAKEGFLDKYLNTPLIPVDNVLVPGTTNTSATLSIADNKIYFIAADSYRPVKVVFEGDSVTIENIPEETNDRTYGISIKMKVGISAIVGSKFGTLTIGG